MLRELVLMGLVAGSAGSMMAQSAPPAAQPKPVRVRPALGGFDISSTAGKAPNQVGGASRGGGLLLYAPMLAKAYTLTPVFYWRSEEPGKKYTFQLAELSAQQAPLFSAKVTGGSYQYPASAPPLQPGTTYVWSVVPTDDMFDGPASASLVIVGGAERQQVTAALEKNPAGPMKPFADAKTCSDQRLWFDAVADYTDLIAAHPERTELYARRADIYAQVPQTAKLADKDDAMVKP